MTGKQCPKVAVVGIGSVAALGGVAPNRIANQVGKQLVELFVGAAVELDETRPAKYVRIFVEQSAGHEVDDLTVEHGVQDPRRRRVRSPGEQPRHDDIGIDDAALGRYQLVSPLSASARECSRRHRPAYRPSRNRRVSSTASAIASSAPSPELARALATISRAVS